MDNIEVLRAEEEWQRAGAYSVRIQGMNRQHHISLREEFDLHDGDGTRYIVLLSDGYPVATCRFFETGENEMTLGRVVVLPEYRGMELGRKTVTEAVKWIGELGYKRVAVDSRVEAEGFYQKLGFRRAGDEIYKSGLFDCVRMERTLTDERRIITLYHTGYEEIREPDITRGRKNADFGQGFYLTGDLQFAKRWARERKDRDTVINTYELDPEGLLIHRFERGRDWFGYIYSNRAGFEDALKEADVITGPIANDTIYDTFGIITSGFIKKEDALKLLLNGPEYTQTVIKTEKALSHLKWISSAKLDKEEIRSLRETVRTEEEQFQRQVTETLLKITGEDPEDL